MRRSVWAIGIIIAILIISIVMIRKDSGSSQQTSTSTLGAADSSLPFTPTELPEGYSFNPATITEVDGVKLYQVRNDKDQTIHVSIQKIPDAFDFVDFHENQIRSKRETDTGLGKLHLGRVEKNHIGSLITSDQWIFISATTDVVLSDIEKVAKSLK